MRRLLGMVALAGVLSLPTLIWQHKAVTFLTRDERLDDSTLNLPRLAKSVVMPPMPTTKPTTGVVAATNESVKAAYSQSEQTLVPVTRREMTAEQQNLTKQLADTVRIGECITWWRDRLRRHGVLWVLHHSSGCRGPGSNLRPQLQHNEATHRIHKVSAQIQEPRAFPQDLPVVMYGSSHLRELYFALVKIQRGLTWRMEYLESNVMKFRPGTLKNQEKCDPNQTGYVEGKFGIDLENCGLPDKAMDAVLVNGTTLARGFKTFLHTPDADKVFAAFLKENHMERPAAAIVDVGVWGTRGHRVTDRFNYTLTPDEEFDYYFNWLDATFSHNASTRILLILEDKEYYDINFNKLMNGTGVGSFGDMVHRRTFQYAASNPFVTLLRKDKITVTKPEDMQCRHGCGGPIMTIVANLTLDWLERIQHPS